MWQPELTDPESLRLYAEYEGVNHYDALPNLPSTKLARKLSVERANNPYFNTNPTHQAYVREMMKYAAGDKNYPFYEGDSRSLLLTSNDYDDLREGYEYMIGWGAQNYDGQYRQMLASKKDRTEALVAVATMYRRDQHAQAVNKLQSYATSMDQYHMTIDLYGEDITDEIKSDLDMGVNIAREAVKPEMLEFFRFNNLNEVDNYFANFEIFLKHQNVELLLHTYATYAHKVDAERLKDDPQTLKILTYDYYRMIARAGLLNYTLLSRAAFGAETGDYKGRTLKKLGIDDIGIVNGQEAVLFPELQVPDNYDVTYADGTSTNVDDFLNSPLIKREDYAKILRNMYKHTSNWNLWYR